MQEYLTDKEEELEPEESNKKLIYECKASWCKRSIPLDKNRPIILDNKYHNMVEIKV
jgi:hypothetical protein